MNPLAIFRRRKALPPNSPRIKAVLFDTFGTTVDWLSSMTEHGERIGAERGIKADWAGLVKEWRAHYQPAIKPVREGKRPWTGFDTLHREELDKIVARFDAKKLNDRDRDLFTQGWHYLKPWSDVHPALYELKPQFILGPLSNGTTRQMIDLARWSNLPWDVIFGADMFRTYKPDKKIYLGAAQFLGLEPYEILMVAAHNQDLDAAMSHGLKTCFVHRPTEDPRPTGAFDYVVNDFEHLARILNAG